MARIAVLFVQGGGEGAHKEDAALAESLERALGDTYRVYFPKMPDEADPKFASWTQKIASEVSSQDGEVLLVGHSLGGAALLKYLAEEEVPKPVAGLFLLAAPSWDANEWNFDDLKLPAHLDKTLAYIPRIYLYHSRDDAVVPFGHLALHSARLPRAIVRAVDRGGHQFGNDLSHVAKDIGSEAAA